MIYEIYDIGRDKAFRLGTQPCGRFFRALLVCGGKLLSYIVDGDSPAVGARWVTIRIALPPGMRQQFEDLCEAELEVPEIVSGQ